MKNLIDIRDVVDLYGVQADVKGAALCPFHTEKTPSFQIYKDTQSFYCFGCGAGGSAIDFVMRMFNLSNLEAARKLGADFNLNLSGRPPTNFSFKSIAKIKEDKELLEEFRRWEKRAFRTVADYYKALRFWGEQFYINQVEYFSRYENDIENIVLVESILDIMIDNTNNLGEQIKFYKNYGKLVREIENRTTS